MRNLINCFFALIFLTLGACSSPEFKQGKGELLYKIVDDQDGPAIGKVATVFLSYTEGTGNGKILAATGKFDPLPLEVFATSTKFIGDMQDAFQYLSEGDSAVIKVSLDSIKKINSSPILVQDTSKYMIYSLRIHKVINQDGPSDDTYLARVSAYENELKLKRKTDEPEKIKKYLAANKLNYKATSIGLLYPADLKIVNNAGKKLYVSYAVTSLDGTPHLTRYENITPEEARFLGLKEALLITPKGVKTKVIIPSELAFGSRGDNYKMPPYAPLICEFTILDK